MKTCAGRMKRPAIFVIIFVCVPMLAGTMIYLLFRPANLLYCTWLKQIGIGFLSDGHPIVTLPESHLFGWLRFSLPDGLWLFAFANALLLIWKDARMQWRFFITGVLGALYIVYEAGQACGVIRGTFDMQDIATCLLSLMLSAIIMIINRRVLPCRGKQEPAGQS